MKIQLLLPVMLLTVCIATAQDRYFEGYIVNASGDTIKGFIKEEMNSHLADQVLFKAKTSENAKLYTVKDIQAFGFEGNIFRSLNYLDEVDSVQKQRFGKLLVEGYYNLYAIYFGVAEHYYYVTSQQGKNFFLFDDVMNNTYLKRNGNFRNHLYFIGQSCSNAMSRVEALTFTEKDVANFVQQANNCIEPGKASSIRFKKGKTEFEGVYLFVGGLPLSNGESELMGQALARFVSPSISRNASLSVGFEYMRSADPTVTTVNSLSTEDDHTVTEIYSIPFQLQYNFTRSWFQPYFCIGFSAVYKRELQTNKITSFGYVSSSTRSNNQVGAGFPVGVGIELYPTSHLIIKAEYRYELFLHDPVVGLAYKF